MRNLLRSFDWKLANQFTQFVLIVLGLAALAGFVSALKGFTEHFFFVLVALIGWLSGYKFVEGVRVRWMANPTVKHFLLG